MLYSSLWSNMEWNRLATRLWTWKKGNTGYNPKFIKVYKSYPLIYLRKYNAGYKDRYNRGYCNRYNTGYRSQYSLGYDNKYNTVYRSQFNPFMIIGTMQFTEDNIVQVMIIDTILVIEHYIIQIMIMGTA